MINESGKKKAANFFLVEQNHTMPHLKAQTCLTQVTRAVTGNGPSVTSNATSFM